VEQIPGRVLFVVADGLGHGPGAAAAAREAVRVFRDNVRRTPAEILHAIDAALRSTRGAAVLVAQIDLTDRQVCCAGVGNISGSIITAGASRSLVSHNGTVGHAVRKVQEFLYPFPHGALLVLHSDGLATSWRLDQYPGLAARAPVLIAGVLYRDFKRGRDDVTVLAAREGAEDRA
jgi:serine phosphatase RsbU (regulator of sigma subunit)